MARPAASLDEIVKNAVEGVVQRTASAIAKSIADAVAARLEVELKKGTGKVAKGRAVKVREARPRAELTKWVADKRARRVPTFVIEQTGLKTKKAIVAKFGENATFEKGKPAPKAKSDK
jgi:hypothetical protein